MSTSLQPSVALAAYAEAVAEGRRVLVVGNAFGALAQHLLERGARFVHVCDPDPLRVAQAGAQNRLANVSFGPLAEGHVALPNGAFDLAIVENLGATDAISVVRRVRRSLSARGIGIFACPNPEARLPLLEVPGPFAVALDYYALYDAVAADFQVVRMLGQAPFVGYAIADFAPTGEPEPALDTAFVPGGAEEPDWFVAVAAQHPIDLEQFYVVQLPTRGALAASSQAGDAEALRRARDDERALRQRVVELERALKSAGTERAREPDPALEQELARRAARIAELEGRAAEAEARAAGAEARTAQAQSELAEVQAAAERELGELRTAQAELSRRLSELDQPASEDASAEVAELERQLRERAAELRKLERELREAERIGRELLRELGARQPPRTVAAAAGAESSQLSTEIARREADLAAASWTIEALTGRLERAQRAAAAPAAQALAELQQRAVLAAQVEGTR